MVVDFQGMYQGKYSKFQGLYFMVPNGGGLDVGGLKIRISVGWIIEIVTLKWESHRQSTQ